MPAATDVVPINPARFYETRFDRNSVTVDGQQWNTGRLAPDQTRTINIANRNNVPANATAAIINIAAVNPASSGFITIHPCNETKPTASTLNFQAGQTIANGATVKLHNGNFCVYTSAATDLIIDVTGYVLPPAP